MNLGGYTVESLVSESPSAQVFKVRHPTLQSVHACKLVPQVIKDVPSVRAAFLQKVQWRIEHQSPFFIRVTDVIETETSLGFVMDWLEGVTLLEHLNRYGKVEVLPAVRWVAQILSALHTFHSDHHIHLDIHPGNVFLQQSDKGALAILMDDGMHVHLQSELQHFSTGVERLRYRAPEEVHQKKQLSFSTDIYRVGVLLYELLVGRTPFGGDTEYSIMHAINGGRYQSVQAAKPDVSAELSEIIDTALQKDPSKRYQTAREMLSAIQSTIPLPDVLEPVEAVSSSNTVEDVDVLIEQDGEWILQSSNPVNLEPYIDSESENEGVPTVKSRSWFPSRRRITRSMSPFLWRYRFVMSTTLLLAVGLYALWLGGFFWWAKCHHWH